MHVDSGFLVDDASQGGVVVFLVICDGGILFVVVFMCIKSVYLSYDTINTSIIMCTVKNTYIHWWKLEEKKEQGSSESNFVRYIIQK